MIQPEIAFAQNNPFFLYPITDIVVASQQYINDCYYRDLKAEIAEIYNNSGNAYGEEIIEVLSSLKRAEIMEQDDERSRILEALSKNPTFRLPSKDFKGFSKFDPIKGTGIPASELIIQDRQ